jgi:hypothetical protein
MRSYRGCLLLLVLAGMCACSKEAQITESTPQAVSVRYDGVIQSLEDATEAARQACTRYGKTAHLRTIDQIAVMERYAHFDCVSR